MLKPDYIIKTGDIWEFQFSTPPSTIDVFYKGKILLENQSSPVVVQGNYADEFSFKYSNDKLFKNGKLQVTSQFCSDYIDINFREISYAKMYYITQNKNGNYETIKRIYPQNTGYIKYTIDAPNTGIYTIRIDYLDINDVYRIGDEIVVNHIGFEDKPNYIITADDNTIKIRET